MREKIKERPIPFSGEMVRAILDGRKTQTRRIVKDDWWRCLDPEDDGDLARAVLMCPYGKVGDRLWVREAWWLLAKYDALSGAKVGEKRAKSRIQPAIWYETDGVPRLGYGRYRPGIFMPRWASRLTLEIVSIRVERLQDISEADARAEGCHWNDGAPDESGLATQLITDARTEFSYLWQRIHGAGSWKVNPWVWVIDFRRVQGEQL